MPWPLFTQKQQVVIGSQQGPGIAKPFFACDDHKPQQSTEDGGEASPCSPCSFSSLRDHQQQSPLLLANEQAAAMVV